MFRSVLIAVLVTGLAACSMVGVRSGHTGMVVATSSYCGTASQDSAVHYFADAQSFGRWISGRNVGEFEPRLVADNGVVVVEMGQRPTGGYTIELIDTRIEGETLEIAMRWQAPRSDAAVSQALIASCVAIKPPAGEFDRVKLLDQLGNVRGTTAARK